MLDAGLPGNKDHWTHPGVILVATDLSDLDRLMPFALAQAVETGARLILLHILPAGVGMAVDAAGLPYYDPAGALEVAGKFLEPWCEQARRLRIECDALVREGSASQQIAASVRQFQADRVLLGTRSRGKLGKLLIGSVAEQLLRSLSVPVITIGPEAHAPAGSAGQDSEGQRVVLYATTLSETSRPSAALACGIAATQDAKLVLLHILPPIDEMVRDGLPTGLDSAALHELRLLAQETGAGCRIEVEAHVVHGNPSIEILAEASERKVGLIVLGATHRSAFENLTRDRTIYKVLAHARCPVLTLREPLVRPAVAEAEKMAIQEG